MKSSILILLDKVFILFYPFALIIFSIIKLFGIFYQKKNNILIIKFMGAGNWVSIIKNLNRDEKYYILTASSNRDALDLILCEFNNITAYYFDIRSPFTLFYSLIYVFFVFIFFRFAIVVNLENESSFAKFLTLIVNSDIKVGLTNKNKSIFDHWLYDRYVVNPINMSKVDVYKFLINDFPVTSDRLVQDRFFFINPVLDTKFFNAKISIFPTCSSLDENRRIDNRTLLEIVLRASKYNLVEIIFPSINDPQYLFINDAVRNLPNVVTLITNYSQFVSNIISADLIVTIDSQALHLAQAYNKNTIAFYGPTWPLGVSLNSKTYVVYDYYVCSPCVHKYFQPPCKNSAVCMKNFDLKFLDNYFG